jgi:hypothetical protein
MWRPGQGRPATARGIFHPARAGLRPCPAIHHPIIGLLQIVGQGLDLFLWPGKKEPQPRLMIASFMALTIFWICSLSFDTRPSASPEALPILTM